MGDGSTGFVEVVVGVRDVRGAQTFHYGIPDHLHGRLQPGQLVLVPFGTRQTHAVVLRMADVAPVSDTRDVLDVIWDTRLVGTRHLEFARWLSEHYAAPILDAIHLVTPPGLARYLRSTYTPAPGGDDSVIDLGVGERKALELVRARGEASQADLKRDVGKTVAVRGMERLVRGGLVNRKLTLRLPSPISERVVVAVEPQAGEDPREHLVRAPKQRALWKYLADAGEGVPVREALAKAVASESVLRGLVERGLARIQHRWTLPFIVHPVVDAEFGPFEADEDAWSPLRASLDCQEPEVVLLQGDEPERFELYIRAISFVVAEGQRALVIAPDARTASELAARLATRVGATVAEAGRATTDAERVSLWQSVRAGEVDVLVGTRAATFSPFDALGLVIVDREEDPGHKNQATPRFHVRTCAEQIARLHQCVLVLGAETPCIESFYRVQKERYQFVSASSARILRQTSSVALRARGTQLTGEHVDVVDLRSVATAGRHRVISRPLLHALRETLHEDGRAVLYVNRRGTAALTVCRDCGHVFGCERCSSGLVHHQDARVLVCHVCNWRREFLKSCPVCQGSHLRLWGYGSEAVTDAVAHLFPKARVARVDSDCSLDEVDAAVDAFERRGGVDVIVGTQRLLAYGPRLRAPLLGIVQADIGLTFPDFLAPERVFLTLMRLRRLVTGGDRGARTIVQTLMPGHHVVEALRVSEYGHFFRTEIAEREAMLFPPLRPLALVSIGHRHDASAEAEARRARRELETVLAVSGSLDVEMLGPAPALIRRQRGQYRWQMMLLGRDVVRILPILHRGWTIDVDPLSLA